MIRSTPRHARSTAFPGEHADIRAGVHPVFQRAASGVCSFHGSRDFIGSERRKREEEQERRDVQAER
jgi:hypothetical protein